MGDEQKLRRVILSLVNNAVKFTEAGCITLVISARPEEYGVNLCVKVKDTGIGIAEEDLEKLFSSFHQADTKRNRKRGGIGLGLVISKKIISKMNGFISAKSELGKGSEFQFVVPQKVVEARPMVTVRDAESMNVLFYINTEKASFSEFRDNYMSSICHMMEGLEVGYHLCRNLGELKRRAEREVYTHALITQEEYREDPVYFDGLAGQLKIIMIQDRETGFTPGGNIQRLYKPFYVLSLAAALYGDSARGGADGGLSDLNKKFTAPEASVLVVDDNMMNLKVVEGLLRPYRIKVITASSGRECLEKLGKLRCDMIFMDHMMPEMDGVETARRIRKKLEAYFQNVPIIALTANAIDGAREMFLEEGFQEYISKPIEIARLEKVLRKYIPADKIIWAETSAAAPAQEPAVEPEPKPTTTEKKSHIDREKGIRYMGGNAEDYEEVLQVYRSDGQEHLSEIWERYQAEDWKNYTIHVHALKSNSFSIGADQLGEMAKALEAAGSQGDAAYIHAHHAEAMQTYQEVLLEIGREALEVQPNHSAGVAGSREGRNRR